MEASLRNARSLVCWLVLIVAVLYTPPLICAAAEEKAALTPAQVLARVRPGVVHVIMSDADGKTISEGSGFIVSADGKVVTNWHVVAGAESGLVKTKSGGFYPVEGLVSWDAEQDFAVLKVAGKGLATVTLGDSDKLKQGDRVLTLGSPLGLEMTASEGIVSAIRELPGGGKLIQTTAAISEGSSGGPLINDRAQVVGITSYIMGEGQSLNFAIPINGVKQKLAAHGKLTPLRDAAPAEFTGSAADLYWQGVLALPADPKAPDAAKSFETALGFFRKAAAKRKTYAEAHFCIGYCLVELGRSEEAIAAYKEAIRLKPDCVEAHFNLGVAYSNLGRHEEAITALREAIRLKPDCVEAHFNLGVAYGNLGRHEEAVAAYEEAIDLRPDFAEARLGMGLSYGNLGKLKEAAAAFKEAIRVKPDYPEAHYNLGLTYGHLGRHPEAVTAFKEAIRVKSGYADAYDGLGSAYIGLSRWEEAVAAFKEAIRVKPDHAEAHCGLAASCILLRRNEEAMAACKEAIRLKPDHAKAHFFLGALYAGAGDRGRALDEYKVLKGLDKDLAGKLFELIYPD